MLSVVNAIQGNQKHTKNLLFLLFQSKETKTHKKKKKLVIFVISVNCNDGDGGFTCSFGRIRQTIERSCVQRFDARHVLFRGDLAHLIFEFLVAR